MIEKAAVNSRDKGGRRLRQLAPEARKVVQTAMWLVVSLLSKTASSALSDSAWSSQQGTQVSVTLAAGVYSVVFQKLMIWSICGTRV